MKFCVSQKCNDGRKMYKQVRCIIVQSCCCFISFLFSRAREARESREARTRRKTEVSTIFLLAFVRLSNFSSFAKMKPKRLIHKLLTFLILFCVSFLCFLFVCLCSCFIFCRSRHRCRHQCQRFLKGCLPLCQNNSDSSAQKNVVSLQSQEHIKSVGSLNKF